MTSNNITSDTQTKTQMKLWIIAVIAFLLLYFPTYQHLFNTVWKSDEQGHGPLVMAIAMFLMWQKKQHLFDYIASKKEAWFGGLILCLGLMSYAVGRSQDVQLLDVGSQMLVLVGLVLYLSGYQALLKVWFPVFFILFMIPLPGTIVDALTMPMKIAVSNVSEWILYSFDYPITREGVMLQIGYYKLLVADACAGLHTVFTLEAMGLLYLHLVKRDSFARNVSLAVLILPISFMANTIRVISLVLVTYYYGDEVGQGFIHDFAGIVLFGTALILIVFVDTLIQKVEGIVNKKKQGVVYAS